MNITNTLKKTSILALAASSVLLTACGGGGGGNSNVIAVTDEESVVITPVVSNPAPSQPEEFTYASAREYAGTSVGVGISPETTVKVFYNDAGVEIAYGIDYTSDDVQLGFIGADYEQDGYSENDYFKVMASNDGSTMLAFANTEAQNLEHVNYGMWSERNSVEVGNISGAFVGGELTANMPTSGSATFVGHYTGLETTNDYSSRFAYKGAVTFDADFANNKVNNFVATADYVNNLNGDWTPVITQDYDFSGTGLDVSGNKFSGTITSQRFVVDVDGAFFGDNAVEAGGVFEGAEMDNLGNVVPLGNRVHGSFGANKQ